MRLLVLGHMGMLGNALCRYFEAGGETVLILNTRYPAGSFLADIKSLSPDFIINCIGAIPQKHPTASEYKLLNEDLPRELDGIGVPVVHPSTDCEFDGRLPQGRLYEKNHVRNATDDYGLSKANISNWLEADSKNTKVIRTSILGHELNSKKSLLDWFLSQAGQVNGYTDQYWNGVTTLEWARQCHALINNWTNAPRLTQLANPDCLSKYEMLKFFKLVYEKDIEIVPFASGKPTNKCLLSDQSLPDLRTMLAELRLFYGQ